MLARRTYWTAPTAAGQRTTDDLLRTPSSLHSLPLAPQRCNHVSRKDDIVQAGGARRWRCGQDRLDDTGLPTSESQSSFGAQADSQQLCLNQFVETYDPTIEDSYRKQVQIDSQSCMLEVLDTAGQEEYTVLRDQWIRDGEGFVLVYSISSRSSFSRIQKFHHQIQRVKESAAAGSPTYPGSPLSQTMGSLTLGPAPVMLVGNKCDRVTEREVSTQEGSALAKQLNCDFVEASAKNCVNVEKAFYDVVRRLRSQRASAPRDLGKGSKPTDGYPTRPYGYDHDRDDRYYRPNGKGGGGRKSKRRAGGSKCVIL